MRVLLPEVPITSIDEYLAAGGGVGIDAARRLGPEGTIEEITASGLRGRGGAGFPTGTKWASVRAIGGGTRYAVANGAEGEPATFKDRTLLRADPYRVVEGLAISALAVGAATAFLATKRSYAREVEALRRAVVELDEAGVLGTDLTIAIVEGPDEYLYGEEKALLEVIEGRDPLPRILPPWQHGLFATVGLGWEAGATGVPPASRAPAGPTTGDAVADGARGASNPTLVNNVETLAAATHVLARGASWYRSMGTIESPGTVIATVVGDVARPGVHEVELGTPFAALLDRCGGPRPGRRFRAALSGVSNPVLRADDFDVTLSYEAFESRGTGLGAAGFAVYDDTRDMVDLAREVSRFLSVESCGQCPPCKEHSLAITGLLDEIQHGRGHDDDLPLLHARLRSVTDANRCFLGTEEQRVISSIMRAFPDDFAAHLEGTAPASEPVLVALVRDVADDGTVTYDDRHARKRPDWTFA